ncbi:MAG: hypothetical protein MUC85_01515 [Anaerolineales bacterium]|jgi:hypothetical protein|nr:hypothetical protein [Anaerolineales bacterium]
MRIRGWLTGCTWLLLVVFLSGCGAGTPEPLPTTLPDDYLPTAIALTIQAEMPRLGITATIQPETTDLTMPAASPTQATQTAAPSDTALPDHSPTPNRLPTRTPSPTPTQSIPDAAIQILAPGPGSRLVSPLRLNTYLKPGLDGRVQIELLGEDGRLLLRNVYSYLPEVKRTYLTENLPFEIRQVGEAARLQISTFDSFGRLLAFNSVDVILLSFGEDDVNPAGNFLERVLITEPLPNKLIQGGTLVVSGRARLANEQPLLIELTTAKGQVVGYRQAGVSIGESDTPIGDYVSFRAEVPYTVTEPTWVRLSVRMDSDGIISGPIYLTSQEILLSP